MNKTVIYLLGLIFSSIIHLAFAETNVIEDDSRIKKIGDLTNNSQDLNILSKIKIIDYTPKDYYKYGKFIRKGLIAQQLETLLPNAISKKTMFIPSVYALSASVKQDGEQTYIISRIPHGFKPGDRIKLILQNKSEKLLLVEQVINDIEFVVNKPLNEAKVFIYGKEVNDFREIDYRALQILQISAIQALQKTTQALMTANQELTKKNQQLSERLNDIEELLEKIPANDIPEVNPKKAFNNSTKNLPVAPAKTVPAKKKLQN